MGKGKAGVPVSDVAPTDSRTGERQLIARARMRDPEALRESLRKMNPEDFGKFSF